MRAKTSYNWQERVLKAREHFLKGLFDPKIKFKVTQKDIERSRQRLMERVKRLSERRF